jgi:hypothetical protein
MTSGMAASDVAVYLQNYPSQHVFPIQPPMRLGGFPQRIARRDRHADPAMAEVTIQLVELTRIRDRVEGMHAERASVHGNRVDTVRVDEAPLGPYEVETPLELVASGQRKHTIQSVGRELPEAIGGFGTPSIDHPMSAEFSDQACRRSAGRCCDNVSPALNGELNRHRADGTRSTEDQHRVSRPQPERVDALECGQPSGGNRSGIAYVEPLRHTAHVLGMCRGELCVEAPLAIAELVCVDAVTELNAPDSCASGHDDSRAVNSGHEGESWSPGLSPRTVANRGIPAADAGRIDRDEHLLRSWPRHWNFMQSQSRRRTESIDRRGFHGVGDITRPFVACSRDSMMSHKDDEP